MKPSLQAKLEQMLERFQEVERLLSEPSIISSQQKFKELSKEFSHLEPVAHKFDEFVHAKDNLASLQDTC